MGPSDLFLLSYLGLTLKIVFKGPWSIILSDKGTNLSFYRRGEAGGVLYMSPNLDSS